VRRFRELRRAQARESWHRNPALRCPLRGSEALSSATMGRRGGGHVGIVTGTTSDGDPILISGNSYGNRVYEGPVDRRRIITYTVGG
jgi:hypothetical protein